MLFYTTFQSRRDSAMLFTFDLNTTYYIAIAVHKLDNNNLHYNIMPKTNKQKNNKKTQLCS